jgi:D-alanine-D-alanine ligase
VRIGMTFNVRSERSAADSSRAAGVLQAGPHGLAGLGDEDEEFDSLETVQAIAAVLQDLGHDVDLLGDGEPLLRRLLDGPRPDLVLNFAEGTGGGRSREARVPAVLEMLGIPYTGSDPLTLAVTLDKDCAKRLVAAAGIATPAWAVFSGDHAEAEQQLAGLRLPLIVKPAFEGSSKGILSTSLVRTTTGLAEKLDEVYRHYQQPVLVEEFIEGDELTVGIVGNQPPQVLGVMRVLPKDKVDTFIYSIEVKRDWQRLVRYECPARLSPADMQAVEQAALAAWRALGCRDVSRIDFRLRDGVPYFLEVNPLPGLSPKSGDLVLLSGMMGIEYSELVSRIVGAAIERYGLAAKTPARC